MGTKTITRPNSFKSFENYNSRTPWVLKQAFCYAILTNIELQLTHAVGTKTQIIIPQAKLGSEDYNSRTSWVLKRYNLRCQLLALLQLTHAVGIKTLHDENDGS